MQTVNVGFIGAGGIARRHRNVLRGFSDVTVRAFSAPTLERAQDLAGEVGATAYADFNQMLEQEQLDAVFICVPPFAHGAAEAAVIARGLPFFVEKPLAIDLETAEHIQQAAAQAGLITAVGYNWRYMDTVDEAKALLADRPARLVLGYWLDKTPQPSWWRHQAESGGQMHEQTTHMFDLARYLVGEVDQVFALGSSNPRANLPDLDILDTTTTALQFSTGAVGTLASTCLLNWNHRVGLHLFGEGLAIEISMHDIMIDIGQGQSVRGVGSDSVMLEDRDFIDAVKGEPNCIRTPYADALLTHRLTLAANQSARTGQPVQLAHPDQTTGATQPTVEVGP